MEVGTHPGCWGAFSSGPSSVWSLPPGSAVQSLLCSAAPGAPAAWAQRALCGGDGICQAAAVRLRAPLHSALLRGRSRPSAARRQTEPPHALRRPRWPPLLCGASAEGRSAGSPERLPTSSIPRPPSPCVPLPTRPPPHAPSPPSRGRRRPWHGTFVQRQLVAAEDGGDIPVRGIQGG